MTRTFGLYHLLPDGYVRLGTYRHRGRGASVRDISAAIWRRLPNMPPDARLFLSPRVRLFGRYADDGQRIPLEPRA